MLHLCGYKHRDGAKKSEPPASKKQLLPFIHFFIPILLSHAKHTNWIGGWISWERTFQWPTILPQEPLRKKGIPSILSLLFSESQLAPTPEVLNCSYCLLVTGGLMEWGNIWISGPESHIRYNQYTVPVCAYLLGTLCIIRMDSLRY